jgi:hypothetical protein
MENMNEKDIFKILICLLILGVFISGCIKRDVSPHPIPTPTPLLTQTSLIPINESEFQKTKETANLKLSQVKVVSVYDRITDGIVIGRSTDQVVAILKETNTDLILKDFIRWEPVPEFSNSIIPGYPANYASNKAKIGYTYIQLGEAINQIKTAKPNIILIGAISTQRLNKIEFNEISQETISQSQTWDMAIDPTKFNLSANLGSKVELQCKAAKALGWISSGTNCQSEYDPSNVPAYFSDITNVHYQELLISRAKKQIDLGSDGIWIDMLFGQANAIQEATGDPNHPAVKASYEAASKVVDEIHNYGYSKGKYIYVGTWGTFIDLPYSPPALDFITASPKTNEITNDLDDAEWNNMKNQITGKLGNIPIFAIIDWGGSEGGVNMPLTTFSQKLTPQQQSAWLVKADDFFTKKGILFAYPIHGGTFPPKSSQLAFGKYNVYDSLAPEFGTYNTIKDLARKKSGV